MEGTCVMVDWDHSRLETLRGVLCVHWGDKGDGQERKRRLSVSACPRSSPDRGREERQPRSNPYLPRGTALLSLRLLSQAKPLKGLSKTTTYSVRTSFSSGSRGLEGYRLLRCGNRRKLARRKFLVKVGVQISGFGTF